MTGDAFPWLVLLRDLSVKSALLLPAAWALAGGMRRASAAARHLVWRLTFAALLLLPLLSLALPPRPIAILPAAPFVTPLVPSPVAAPPVPLSAPPDAVRDTGPPPPVSISAAHVRPPAVPAWPVLLGLLWLGGAGLAVLPLGLGWLGAARRLRRCPRVSDPSLIALAGEAGRLVGLPRPVSLRSGPLVAVPVTFGLLRPTVLLPEGAASWPAERLRVALLHEMAHVRRGDWATQTAARLACALFWHIPLAWLGARRLRAEAERACDDLVLLSGIPAPDYAGHLLAVAAALSGANLPLPLAVPMAGPGTPLESRLCAVLTARPRRAPSRRLAALAFVLALVVLVPLAALRPAARQVAPPLPSAPAARLALPKALRPSPAPVSPARAAPPLPVLVQPTLKGVPPMKPPAPVETVALAALAAGLALPAAHARPSTPVPLAAPAVQNPAAPANAPVNLPVAQGAHPAHPLKVLAPLPVDPVLIRDLGPYPVVTLDLKKVPIRQALDSLFAAGKANYTVAAGVPDDKDSVTLHLTNVPLVLALDALLAASDPPLAYTIKEGIFAVTLRRPDPFRFQFTPIRPGAADPAAASLPMLLSPLKPGSAADLYKIVPNKTLFAPLLLTPVHPKGAADPALISPSANGRPLDPVPEKAP